MARLLGSIAATLLLAGPALAQDRTLTIVSVNDTHSTLDASGPKDANLDGTIGGLVKAAPLLAELAGQPNTVFLHAGDLFMGDLYFNAFHGVPELQLLAQLGLDAMVVGNHELWYPPCLVLGPVWGASAVPFPLLGANVLNEGCLPFLVPSALLHAGDVTVGVVGLTTPFDLIAQLNAPILGAADPPAASVGALIGIALPHVAALRAQGAEVVILLSHLPRALDEALAANLPGIDAVIGGHDHHEVAELVERGAGSPPVPVVHAGAYYQKIGKVRLSVGAEGVSSVLSAELLSVDQRVPRPAPAESLIAATVAQLQQWVPAMLPPGTFDPADPFHAPIAFAEKNVSHVLNMKVPKRDTGTGNLVTDALRAHTGTDLAFTVTGQTPQGLAAGPVVQADLFRMVGVGLDSAPLPRIARAEVAGYALAMAIETTIEASLSDDDFILQVSGMRYVYDSSLPLGQRIVSVEVGGQPLDYGRLYSATMNALLFQMLPELGIPIVSGELLDASEFSVVRDHVAGLGTFIYAGENRVRDLAAQGRKD